MNKLVNVPDVNSPNQIGCTYDKESNTYQIHTVNADGARTIGMGYFVCGSTKESIEIDIAEALTQMQKIGFEQGRKHVRKALGIE